MNIYYAKFLYGSKNIYLYDMLTRVSQIAKGKAKKWRKMEKKRLKSVLPNKIIKIYN